MKIESIQIDDPACTLAYALWKPIGACRGTVVAVHGLSRQKRDFDFIAASLAERGYRVFTVDAPGRGDSSKFENPEQYRNDVYADVFCAFLQKMRLNSVHWIGASMGGLIALEIAKKGYHDLFRSLTLVDITHKPNRAACERIAGYVSEDLPIVESIERKIELTKANLPLGDVSEDVWRHFAVHQLIPLGGNYIYHFDPKIVPQARRDLHSPADLSAGLSRLNCPLALVAGEVSDLCTKEEIAELKALKPDVLIRLCPNAGHIPSLSDDATKAFIGGFIDAANGFPSPQSVMNNAG